MATVRILCLTLLAVASNANPRVQRNIIGDALGQASSSLGLDSLVYGGAKLGGAIGGAISPQAMRTFCETNGYTVWVGQGPPPAPEASAGWSLWGKLAGVAVGAWAPDIGFKGQCDSNGWAKPGTTTGTIPGGPVNYVNGGLPPGAQFANYQPRPTTVTTTYYPGPPVPRG